MKDEIALEILARVDAIERHFRFTLELWEMLALRGGVADATHLSLAEAAGILRVSVKTARRNLRPYLVRIPGNRGERVPVERVLEIYASSDRIAATPLRAAS